MSERETLSDTESVDEMQEQKILLKRSHSETSSQPRRKSLFSRQQTKGKGRENKPTRRKTVLNELFSRKENPSPFPLSTQPQEGEVNEARLSQLRKRSTQSLTEVFEDGEEGRALLEQACFRFNLSPSKCRLFLVEEGILSSAPSDFADFIFQYSHRLSKRRIGEFIGGSSDIQLAVCESLFSRYQFQDLPLESALRTLLRQFRLPGESQEIDRIMEQFAHVYVAHNPQGRITNPDTVYILSFSLVMLNTDLHSANIAEHKRISFQEWQRNNRGIDHGKDVPEDLLYELYQSVKAQEISMNVSDLYESEVVTFMAPLHAGWLEKKSHKSMMGGWKKHWFLLIEGCLYYFLNPQDSSPRCTIPLDNTSIEWEEHVHMIGDPEFLIRIRPADGQMLKTMKLLDNGQTVLGKHRELLLRSRERGEYEEWLKELRIQSDRFSPLNDQMMRLRRETHKTEEELADLPFSPLTHKQKRRVSKEKQDEGEGGEDSSGESKEEETEESMTYTRSHSLSEMEGEHLTDPTRPNSASFSSFLPFSYRPSSSSSPSPSNTPVACGWMKKRGWINTAWKRRYFVLYPDVEGQGPALFYFVSPSMAIRMYKQGEPSHRGFLRLREVTRVSLKEITTSSSSSNSSFFPEIRHSLAKRNSSTSKQVEKEEEKQEKPKEEEEEDFDEDKYVIEVHTRDRVWEFSPPSREELNQWLALLAEAWESGKLTEPSLNSILSVHRSESPFYITQGEDAAVEDRRTFLVEKEAGEIAL